MHVFPERELDLAFLAGHLEALNIALTSVEPSRPPREIRYVLLPLASDLEGHSHYQSCLGTDKRWKAPASSVLSIGNDTCYGVHLHVVLPHVPAHWHSPSNIGGVNAQHARRGSATGTTATTSLAGHTNWLAHDSATTRATCAYSRVPSPLACGL